MLNLTWTATASQVDTTSPCARDSHSVAAEMHNVFAKDVVSTEGILRKAISMARL